MRNDPARRFPSLCVFFREREGKGYFLHILHRWNKSENGSEPSDESDVNPDRVCHSSALDGAEGRRLDCARPSGVVHKSEEPGGSHYWPLIPKEDEDEREPGGTHIFPPSSRLFGQKSWK